LNNPLEIRKKIHAFTIIEKPTLSAAYSRLALETDVPPGLAGEPEKMTVEGDRCV
jgi:hypothetical protein